MAKGRDSSIIHVELEEPVELRKGILKTAIDITEVQKSQQDFKRITKEKEHYKKELRKVFNFLKSEIEKLEEILPKPKLEEPKPEKKEEEEKPKHIITKKDIEKAEKRILKEKKVDKLSSDLEDLSRKLRNL